MGSPTVLIVEDDRPIATLLGRVLQTGGYEVLEARSGTEAICLGQLHRQEIDLLLCDIMLEDQAGRDVALRVGELCPRIKTLFTSGYSLEVLIERGLLPAEIVQDENTAYIQKPFRPNDLLHAVNDLVPSRTQMATSGFQRAGGAHVSAAAY